MIVKAKTEDISDIVMLWERVSLKEFSNYIGKENIEFFIQNDELLNEITHLHNNIYVFKLNKKIVGFVILIDNLIELLIVSPEDQNGLIGKKLYLFAINKIFSKYDTVIAECFNENKKVNSLLQRLGFIFVKSYQEEMGFITNQYIKTIK